jgi:hypothetical protein
MGCFAKGCLILVVFFFLLAAAFVGGTYMAIRYLRTEYFPKTKVELPVTTPGDQEQEAAKTKWQEFENHVRAHEPATLEMTGDELNALIASEPVLRGKAHVSIEGDTARLRVSIPLDSLRWLQGHYMNGECTIQSGVTGDLVGIRITSVVVNDRPVPDEALQWRYGPWSVRRYIDDWSADRKLKKFEIRDGKVILETAASPQD